MFCQKCKKREAIFHYTRITEDKLTKLHLCEICAEQEGFTLDWEKSDLSLADLLAVLADIGEIEEEVKSCPECGTQLSDFQKTGFLGCQSCFDTFSDEIGSLLEKLHGSTQHQGKLPATVPEGIKKVRTQAALRSQLEKAVKKEEYEKAAKIRDKIKALEKSKSHPQK